MSGPTILLAYAAWAAAPIVAYAALSHGLKRGLKGFALLFGTYTAAVWTIWGALHVQAAAGFAPAVPPWAMLGSWAGVAVLSALLYGLGAWIGGGE